MILFEAKTRQTHVISGMGSAPRSKEAIEWYMKHGIPPRHDIKIAPVPSVVDLCTTLLQHYGTKTFEEIVTPAISLLGIGSEPFKPKLAATLQRLIEAERSATGSRKENLALSQRRADSIRQVLANAFKISAKRLHALGLGEEQLKDAARPTAPVNARVQIIALGRVPPEAPKAAESTPAKKGAPAKKRRSTQ